MSDSINHTEQDLLPDLQRELFLHKVIAVSAFVFCLCALPLLQSWLDGNLSVATTSWRDQEQGQVAGVKTEAPTTGAATRAQNPKDCIESDLEFVLCQKP